MTLPKVKRPALGVSLAAGSIRLPPHLECLLNIPRDNTDTIVPMDVKPTMPKSASNGSVTSSTFASPSQEGHVNWDIDRPVKGGAGTIHGYADELFRREAKSIPVIRSRSA